MFVILGFVGVMSIGGYAVRSSGMVERRMRDWREGFMTGVESVSREMEEMQAKSSVDKSSPESTGVAQVGKNHSVDSSDSPTANLATNSTPEDSQSQNGNDNWPDDGSPIVVSALPIPRVPEGGAEEKFLGYLPHSGFHNQRIELENALLLGKLLGRTV